MTVHSLTTKTDSTRVKSKIILPLKPSTKLLPKNIKITTKSNKIGKFTIYFYNKIKINTVLATPNIQNRPIKRYKVHSTLV